MFGLRDEGACSEWHSNRPTRVRPSCLVERRTRLLRLVALPAGIKAPAVRDALIEDLITLPSSTLRSLTWDRGREMADHATITKEVGCPTHFSAVVDRGCD